eukprot:CAMPEP_0195282938 /NCGR_PEP_ID=MMETSP0707-20130614/1648_1 /TAXON_ID=33640 /ORGANISM="Asterionellopsis glacialis, Strain CCMP134" /LENGTH=339 /DNA_ID=CAMNT_0040342017 /DNA_START=81 /DNA_END=1100 /DNA_ORIENTATION=-
MPFTITTMFLGYLLTISVIYQVASFTATNHRVSFVHPQRQLSSSSSSLSVLIYGWDENDEECAVTDSINDYDMGGESPAVCSAVGIALAESISQNQDRVGTLARLACAFSPSDKTLDLKDIEHVHLVCVSEKHIEIEAVLCEDHNCVSLFVPIEFPHDCGQNVPDTYLEKCVLDNLEYLDVEAESLVVKSLEKNNKNGQEEHVDNEGHTLLLSVEELSRDFAYPTWWVSPDVKPDLVEECDTISRLLHNDEFKDSVNGLARKGLEALGMQDAYKIHQAVAVAVGPAGICLKAQGSYLLDSSQNSDVVLDIPLPFGGEARFDADSLRAAVLGEIAACQVF